MLLHTQKGARPDWLHTFVTLRCNHSCGYCSVSTNGKTCNAFGGRFKELTAEEWGQVFRKRRRNVIVCGGEPMLHPEIMDILWAIPLVRDVRLFTNGMLLTDDQIYELGEWATRSRDHGGTAEVDISYHPPADVSLFVDRVLRTRAAGVPGCQMAIKPVLPPHQGRVRCVKRILQDRRVSFTIRKDATLQLATVTAYNDPPEQVYCRRRHIVLAPDGRRYPCVRHMLVGTAPMEDSLNEGIRSWEQTHTCQSYGKCTTCDLDRWCKIATTPEEAQGPVRRKDFQEGGA